jgi:hypothetical protein
LLAFVVAVEDELAVEWNADLDPAVTSSFDAMADYIVSASTHASR